MNADLFAIDCDFVDDYCVANVVPDVSQWNGLLGLILSFLIH